MTSENSYDKSREIANLGYNLSASKLGYFGRMIIDLICSIFYLKVAPTIGAMTLPWVASLWQLLPYPISPSCDMPSIWPSSCAIMNALERPSSLFFKFVLGTNL